VIGIVVVSHSARLAEGVCELAAQAAQGRVPLAAAGGMAWPEAALGTDPRRVQQAIESVYSQDGVVVLMDLGSALLSAEMAVELLPQAHQGAVRLCEAPLVEGAVAAAVQAAAGSDVDRVLAEARGALAAKVAQLAPAEPVAPTDATPTAGRNGPAAELVLTIPNRLGLHARPAAHFVRTAARFRSRIHANNLTRRVGPADAKSINQLLMLALRQGDELRLAAEGPDAEAALAALRALVEDGFGEAEGALPQDMERPSAPPGAVAANELAGLSISPGIAIGPLARDHPMPPTEMPERPTGEPEEEWLRLQAAIQAARHEVEDLLERARGQAPSTSSPPEEKGARGQAGDEAALFEAHLLFLDDPALNHAARRRIVEERSGAEAAWQAVIDETEAAYRALDDAYLRERALDVADVGRRVLRRLAGSAARPLIPAHPAILVADELTPSDVAGLDAGRVLGVCTEFGGPTSHSAILLRALGIPAVSGVGPALSELAEGTPLALDGQQGRVWVAPDPGLLAELRDRRQIWQTALEAARRAAQMPARSRDGRPVEVVANIGGPADARAALASGAEGVGVLRTEFLFLNRPAAPSEDEQLAAYAAIASVIGKRPLIIRTLDAGGDKALPYLEPGHEANPFLGWRGIRIGLDRPELLKTQLRAILRASPGRRIKIMFPMVSTPGEVRAAKAMLAEVQAELCQAGIPFDRTMEVGVMLEVPAAIAVADQLAGEVQFFSIGTNDLCQYLAAADRTNARVAALADGFQPALLRMVRQAVQVAHVAGIWVGLCGELAGDPLATPLLLGLGLDELSIAPAAIPVVKGTIGRWSMPEAEAMAAEALRLDSAQAVRQYLAARR
jgi:phosphoenolpyruvate-protein phosphotransferase/dihydroxyacetone kinase phosphotransfer subunit